MSKTTHLPLSPSLSNSLFNLTKKVSFEPIREDNSIFINSTHNKPHVLILKNDRVEIISIETGLEISSWRMTQDGFIRQLKASTDFLFLGVLRSAKALEIRTLYEENAICSLVRNDKSSDSILGFEWTFLGELLLLTTEGVEFFQVDYHATKFTKTKSIKLRMNWYQYWPETRLLILSSGSFNLFIYRLSPSSQYETFPILQLVLPKMRSPASSQSNLNFQITRKNIYTMSFYSHCYVGFLNTWLTVPTLSLFRITTKTCYRKEYELDLQQPGDFSLIVIDNLLVINNYSTKTSIVFDVRSSVHSNPLIEPSSEIFDVLGPAYDHELNQVNWSCHVPKFLISGKYGSVWNISLNLSYLLDQLDTLKEWNLVKQSQFIIRRKSNTAYPLRTRPIKQAMLSLQNLSDIRSIYDVLCVNYEPTRYVSRAPSFESMISELSSKFSVASLHSPVLQHEDPDSNTICFQDDMFCHVFTPLATKIPSDYFIQCLLEFIECQMFYEQSVKSFIYDLLVHSLFESNSFVQLHQLIQFHIIPDSIPLAQRLVSNSENLSNLEMGINMLKRLECHNDVLSILTAKGSLLDAILYAQQSHTLKFISPLPFLESALNTGDNTLFLNVYRCFEEHGLIPLAMTIDDDSITGHRNGIARYISIFREIWGASIDMERL
ncbi:colon cancer-associated protein Mic1-like-domain-containing protein [Globomyces pollinis-pini]|nr:colon cancer-associated protein Mic1-like-domain-containing protein [Globomyces pollinis-pini]